MTVIGLEISKWQGMLTAATVANMKTQGVRFVGVKVSQGSGYEDPLWRFSVPLLKAAGILVYPYHFVTTDRADLQFSWFASLISHPDLDWDLPPAMDCEAYTPVSRLPLKDVVSHEIVWSLTYPTEATVDVIGRNLTDWMLSRPKLVPYKYPMIYTNASSGNVIFKTASMSRYSLWVANWGATTPLLPNVWKGKKYIIWQDNVVDGRPYGIDGKVDHNLWGELFPFPGEPTPPPPGQDTIDLSGVGKDGSKWSGRLTETV